MGIRIDGNMVIILKRWPKYSHLPMDAALIITTLQAYISQMQANISWISKMGMLNYWPFVKGKGVYQSQVDSPEKGQWHRTLTFYLSLAWAHCWTNSTVTDDLRRHGVCVILWNVLDIFPLKYQYLFKIWWLKCPTNILGLLALNVIYSIIPHYKSSRKIYYHSSHYWHLARAINAMSWSIIPWMKLSSSCYVVLVVCHLHVFISRGHLVENLINECNIKWKRIVIHNNF